MSSTSEVPAAHSSSANSSSANSSEIKQELLDTLDKLITHSQSEAQQLKNALETLRNATLSQPAPESPPAPVKTEPVEEAPAPAADEPLLGMSTLLKIKEELLKDLNKINRLPSAPPDSTSPLISAKRPRIELNLPVPAADPSPSSSSTENGTTPMVLVPIPASVIEELLRQNPGSPIVSQLQQQQQPPPAKRHRSDEPAAAASSSPLLSPTLTSSVLRFCERRAARDSVDVFHYLPADAKTSPFTSRPPPPPSSSIKSTNYRKLLDDLTSTPTVSLVSPLPYTDLLGKNKGIMNERTVYTPEQAYKLEEAFNKNCFLTKDDREQLSLQLNIHPDRIKVWYQNRRAKRRREEILKERIELAAKNRTSEM